MALTTLTVIALGRIHISSVPLEAIEMLCFNYTVGFSESVAVLNCPSCLERAKIGRLTSGELPRFNAAPPSQCPAADTGVQSHSLSQGYRADLPTSLGRVLFSLEVTCLGDLMRLSVRSPPALRSPTLGDSRPSARPRAGTYSGRGACF